MAKVMKAEEVEAGVEENGEYFYQRLGELRFTSESDLSSNAEAKGYKQRLAVASKHGVAVFADQRGVYIAKVQHLLSAATRGEEDQELPPANAVDVCVCTLPLADASVALSYNEELLAAWNHQKISVWSLGTLIHKRGMQPLTEWLVPGGTPVKQLAWRPARAPGTVPEAAVVTVKGQLLRGSLGGRLQPLPDVGVQVSCVAWSVDGSQLALATENCVTIQHLDSGRHFRTEFHSKEAQDADGVVTVDTLAWVGPQSVLVSASLHPVEDIEAEMDIAPLALVRWAAWDVRAGADPEELQLVEFIPPAVNPEAAAPDSGPYTRVAHVPAWGAVVVAHSKASDDHVRLYEIGPNGTANAVDVTEDWSAIRIPMAKDYNDNYVTGLGMDFTSMDVEVMPPDPEASALGPSPVLLVATSDGALRLFTFAHMTKPTEGVVAPALEFSDVLPPMASEEEEEQTTVTEREAEHKAVAAPLPSSEDESGEEEGDREDVSKEPAAVPLGKHPAKAREERAAAVALPPSSDEDEESSERSAGTGSSSSATAARAAQKELPSDESDLEDDADSRVKPGASSDAGDRPSISRLDLADNWDDEDAGENRIPLGPISGRRLDFGSGDAAGTSKAAHKSSAAAAPGQSKAAPPLSWASTVPPAAAAPSSFAAPLASSPGGFSFGSMPAFSAASAGAFDFARQAASSAAASSGTAAGSAPFGAGSNLGIWGSSAAVLGSAPGATATSSVQNASSLFPKSQGSLPSLPPQSAAQKAIAKAREAAATKAVAAAAAPTGPQAFPSEAPQPSVLSAAPQPSAAPAFGAGKVSATSMAGTAAQKRSAAAEDRRLQAAPTQHAPVRQKPPAPEARLKGESKELAAMEEDFLKTLAETRELEHAFSEAMTKSEGSDTSGPGTRLGFAALRDRTNALKSSVTDILASLASERRRFGELHNGWREDRARAEALLFFNGKHSNGSVDDAEALDPALQELATSIDDQLNKLQKQGHQLDDCLKTLEERGSTRLTGAASGSRASAQQLYNAVNAQTAVATAQLERLELLWQKLHAMGISEDLEDDESGAGIPPAFPYISALRASKPFSSADTSPSGSSRRTWQQVRKSPLARAQPRRPGLLSPLASSGGTTESPWALESAASLRRLLLEKVSIEDGGVRLTRIGGTVFPRLSQPEAQKAADWSSPTKGVVTQPQLTNQSATPAPLASPFGSLAQHEGPATVKQPTAPLSFGQSAGLTRAGSTAAALDRIQPQAAAFLQRDAKDANHRDRHPSISPAAGALETKGKLGRRESSASVDSTGSTSNAALRPKHARSGGTLDFSQPPSTRPFQRPASGLGLARAGSAALAHAEPAESSDSAAESTNKGPTHRLADAAAPAQATIPEEEPVPKPSAAKMPPVPSRAAVAAAQAQGQAALQKAAPAASAKMPPVPSRAAVAAAQAQGQAALRISNAAPPAKTPPLPDKAAVAAAQAKGQAALQQSGQTPPAAKVPPVPSRTAVAAAQAQGQAALQKKAPAPAARMPPVPSKAALAAAHSQAQAALQKSTPAASSSPAAASTAASASPFVAPSTASAAQPVFNFAKLSAGDTGSPTASAPASLSLAPVAQSQAAFSFASAMPSSTPATGASASPAVGAVPSLFGAAQPSAAATPTPALGPSTSQPFLGSFGVFAPLASSPMAPAMASAHGISFGVAPAVFASASSAAASSAFTGFGQQAATPSSPLTSTFGSQAPTPSTAAFGTLSFGSTASQQMSSPATLASGFGAFGGLGQSAPASSSGASPFGKGISFNTPASSSAPSPFGGFGQPSTGAAMGFAGFSQSAPAFSQSQTPMSSAAHSSGPFSGGFGQSTGFGQAPVSGGFGQPAALGSAFGQPAKPGFGQVATPGFGTPATPGFGAPATPAFGSPAAPTPPFGSATGSNAFGAAAAQGSGFGAFASMAGQPSPFGAAAQSGGGAFAAAAQQGGSFGGFGGGSGFGALGGGAPSSPAASPGNSDMWQMRK